MLELPLAVLLLSGVAVVVLVGLFYTWRVRNEADPFGFTSELAGCLSVGGLLLILGQTLQIVDPG